MVHRTADPQRSAETDPTRPAQPRRRSLCSRRSALTLAAVILSSSLAAAQQAPPNGVSPEAGEAPDRAATEARRAEVAATIGELQAQPDANPERLALLERLERLLSQSLDGFERREELATQRDTVRQQLARPAGEQLGHGSPFSLAEYDAALAAHESAERVQADLRQAAGEAATAIEAARKALEDAERQRRAARDTSDAAALPELDDLRVELAANELWLRRGQAENAHSAVETQTLQVSSLRAVVDWVESRVVPQPAELAAQVAELDAQAAALSRQREQAELQLQASRARWERLASRPSTGQTDEQARAEQAARRAEFSAFQKQVALLGERLDRLTRAQELLRRRSAVYARDRPDRAQLAEWDDEIREALAALEREIRLDRAEQAAFSQERSVLEGSLGSGPERPWQERQLRALQDAVAAYDANLASLEESLRLERQLRDSLQRELGSLNLAERVEQLGTLLADVWRFEITSSEDRSITVGKMTTGLMVFVFGLLLARGFTHWAGPRIFSRVRVDEGAAHAYQSLGYYALLAIAFITALRIVDIPLTAFAVVGGALAIGIGFGSQNIVNNFISGLILLAERPIKRGDLVELEGTYGNIERIGLRSTRVRTGDNIHVIVPNSAFLENKVINWTHNDRQVRIKISVGVVYGSPTQEVARLFRQAIEEQPQVLKTPEPIVLFSEFGDNSLNFEARFWVVIRSLMGRLLIESAIRFRIDELFREAGIIIAFPQRDVHLDASAPIPVRLMTDRDEAEDGA
jgi:potassium efflux system protein